MTIEEFIAQENKHLVPSDIKLLKIESRESVKGEGCPTCNYGEYDFRATIRYEYQGAEWKLELPDESYVIKFLNSLFPEGG